MPKFQDHRTAGSGEEDFLKIFTINGHGSHLGHVTWTIYIHFRPPFLSRLHMKVGIDWPSGFREELETNGHVHVYSPGAGADNPLGSNLFYNVSIVLCCKNSLIR